MSIHTSVLTVEDLFVYHVKFNRFSYPMGVFKGFFDMLEGFKSEPSKNGHI